MLHAGERTGPPLFALQLLRWLRAERPGWRTSTLLLDAGGPLVTELEELGPVVVADGRAPYRAGRSRLARARTALGHRGLRRELERLGPLDVAHVHCAGSLRVRPALPAAPVLAHLHELSVGLDLHLGPLARAHVTSGDRYVAVSDGVRDAFLERFAVDPGRVERQWGFVDRGRLPAPGRRAALGIPDDAVLVVASGVRHWRKAPELFVRVARAAQRGAPDIAWRFVWVGGQDAGGLEETVTAAGLDDLVRFLPHQDDALGWLEAADIFALPAREDAFPLVCVEATAVGRPVVTFDNGGAADVVGRSGGGEVVAFPDVDAMAAALIGLARDPQRRAELGSRARAFAHDHLLLEHAGPRLLATIEAVAGARP